MLKPNPGVPDRGMADREIWHSRPDRKTVPTSRSGFPLRSNKTARQL